MPKIRPAPQVPPISWNIRPAGRDGRAGDAGFEFVFNKA